jgi:predicted esterase
LGAIIAAPDCPARDWAQPESQLFVEELIEHLKASYSIDPDRVLLIGYSMGGIGCWHLGIERPTNFTAVVIMAAKPPDNILREGWRLPIFVIHGKKDELFPVVDTTRAVLALEEAGVDVHYRILENTSHYETYKFLPVLKEEVKSWLANRWGFQVSV